METQPAVHTAMFLSFILIYFTLAFRYFSLEGVCMCACVLEECGEPETSLNHFNNHLNNSNLEEKKIPIILSALADLINVHTVQISYHIALTIFFF